MRVLFIQNYVLISALDADNIDLHKQFNTKKGIHRQIPTKSYSVSPPSSRIDPQSKSNRNHFRLRKEKKIHRTKKNHRKNIFVEDDFVSSGMSMLSHPKMYIQCLCKSIFAEVNISPAPQSNHQYRSTENTEGY